MSSKVAFILGGGPNIGQSVAAELSAKGWRVAIAARSLKEGLTVEGYLYVQLDLTRADDVQSAFDKVKDSFGAFPNLVVYNAAARTVLPPDDPLSALSISVTKTDFIVNAVSPLAAAKSAVKGFATLPDVVRKTFIFTGNKLSVMPYPPVISFGMGKSAAQHMIEALTKSYPGKSYRFYYADQRSADGQVVFMDRDGPAHAELYAQLAEREHQGPWYYTFVKDRGYTYFGDKGA